MKLFASVLMVLLATTFLSGCGDGPCDAGFSFKYCLNQSSSIASSSSSSALTLGGTVSGLGSGKTVKLEVYNKGVSVNTSDPTFSISDNSGQESATMGWSFTVATSRTVTHLGVWSGGGLGNVDLGLWDGSGNLLSNISVNNANIATYETDGEFSYAPLPASVVLTAGQTYTVGGFYKGGGLVGYGAPVTPTSGLSYVAPSLALFGATLAYPTEDFSGFASNGYFGPNLLLSTKIPETISVSSDGSFTFPNVLLAGDTYFVSVSEQPNDQSCGITNGTGTMVATAVTNVTVTCVSSSP